MNRRDFLFIRSNQRIRTVELSCERLYMRYLDSRVTDAQRGEPSKDVGESWSGEPPTVIDGPTPPQLFQDLDRDLRDVQVLRIVDSSWLASEELKRELEGLLASFRARGGRVEFLGAPGSSHRSTTIR